MTYGVRGRDLSRDEQQANVLRARAGPVESLELRVSRQYEAAPLGVERRCAGPAEHESGPRGIEVCWGLAQGPVMLHPRGRRVDGLVELLSTIESGTTGPYERHQHCTFVSTTLMIRP